MGRDRQARCGPMRRLCALGLTAALVPQAAEGVRHTRTATPVGHQASANGAGLPAPAVGFLSRNSTASADVASSTLQPVDTVSLYNIMMCWERLKAAEDPCEDWMVEQCKTGATGQGYCQKLKDLVGKNCDGGKAAECNRAVQLGIRRAEAVQAKAAEKPKAEEKADEETGEEKKDAEKTADKEKAAEEPADKEKKAEKGADEEKKSEEAADKEKKAEEAADKEKKSEEVADKEKKSEEVADKEKKAEEVADKEKKAEEAADKEKKSEEAADKEKKAEEAADKEKKSEEAADKEKKAEEAADKEKKSEEATDKEKKSEEATDKEKKSEEAEDKKEAVPAAAPASAPTHEPTGIDKVWKTLPEQGFDDSDKDKVKLDDMAKSSVKDWGAEWPQSGHSEGEAVAKICEEQPSSHEWCKRYLEDRARRNKKPETWWSKWFGWLW